MKKRVICTLAITAIITSAGCCRFVPPEPECKRHKLGCLANKSRDLGEACYSHHNCKEGLQCIGHLEENNYGYCLPPVNHSKLADYDFQEFCKLKENDELAAKDQDMIACLAFDDGAATVICSADGTIDVLPGPENSACGDYFYNLIGTRTVLIVCAAGFDYKVKDEKKRYTFNGEDFSCLNSATSFCAARPTLDAASDAVLETIACVASYTGSGRTTSLVTCFGNEVKTSEVCPCANIDGKAQCVKVGSEECINNVVVNVDDPDDNFQPRWVDGQNCSEIGKTCQACPADAYCDYGCF